MPFTLALVGRPNVGKSTLFNRLAKKKLAIIDDRPGVTRDWREADGILLNQPLRVIDTAGLEDRFDGSLEARMRVQTERAIDQSDAILFIIDGKDGVTPMDKHFAQFLRTLKKPVILAVNKCDNEGIATSSVGEAYGLGFGEPIAISSAHGYGLDDLYGALTPFFPEDSDDDEDREDNEFTLHEDDLDAAEGNLDFDFAAGKVEEEKPLKLAIVGRPNVGKSTLMNTLLGTERVMTGPEAGITRDAIAAAWEWKGRKIRLVDTAGLRRKARITDRLEKMSADETLRAIRLAHVVILGIDATGTIDTQDLQIARHVIEEGRVLVIALNKWDAVQDKQKTLNEARETFEKSLGQLPNVPMVTISAERGTGIDRMMEMALKLDHGWRHRAATGPLNRWLDGAISHHPPPLVRGRPNALRYITQINVKPPTFALWCGHPKELPDSYRRYLMNGLRERFDFPPVPIRLMLRKTKNPFTD